MNYLIFSKAFMTVFTPVFCTVCCHKLCVFTGAPYANMLSSTIDA